MDSSFFEERLYRKLKSVHSIKGDKFKIKDKICDDVTFGCYEIIYSNKMNDDQILNIIGLNRISDDYKIESGKYIVSNALYKLVLYPSQFIHFDIREYREMKLNEILK